ncbi:MAG: 3'-5' exoribonuclease [Bdellovibrionaceae bacterium]|nr:3'-5' exoribonuclease [Pseudobdellovibrionaceae bacterium]
MSELEKNWKNTTWVALDTETTGKYPLESEICEIAAVKWRDGEIVGKYQQLIKPSKKMNQTVIDIHHITNEMVENSPPIEKIIVEFYNFINDAYLIAHHAPFDLGFLAIEFEKNNLSLPLQPVFCSSLISRHVYPESTNHRLQTLIDFFQLPKGQAHRALDDAMACLSVTIKCFERMGDKATLNDILKRQGKKLYWASYSLTEVSKNAKWQAIFSAIKNNTDVHITYQGGSRPGKERLVSPIGLVRSPNGDFLVAKSEGDEQSKRYFLNKISNSR